MRIMLELKEEDGRRLQRYRIRWISACSTLFNVDEMNIWWTWEQIISKFAQLTGDDAGLWPPARQQEGLP